MKDWVAGLRSMYWFGWLGQSVPSINSRSHEYSVQCFIWAPQQEIRVSQCNECWRISTSWLTDKRLRGWEPQFNQLSVNRRSVILAKSGVQQVSAMFEKLTTISINYLNRHSVPQLMWIILDVALHFTRLHNRNGKHTSVTSQAEKISTIQSFLWIVLWRYLWYYCVCTVVRRDTTARNRWR